MRDAVRRDDHARHRREELPAERRDRDADHPAARLAPRRAASHDRRRAGLRRASSTSGSSMFHNARELLDARQRAVLLPAEARVAPRGAALGATRSRSPRSELGLPHGSIRCTVLIETILAAFEMDEILYELRDYGCALNAGRWDYIFSCIKKFRDARLVLPDRVQVTMTVPFMRAYTELLVRTCHRRGAHAIGGMAAFIPSRKDPEVNAVALAKVREDKERESRRRLRRHLGRASRISCRSRPRCFDARARRPAEPARAAARRRRPGRGGAALDPGHAGGEITEAGPARRTSRVGDPLPRRVAARRRRGRDRQPDGGRGDRRDLARRRSGSGCAPAGSTAAQVREEIGGGRGGRRGARSSSLGLALGAGTGRVPDASCVHSS